MLASRISAIRGMKDYLPSEVSMWQVVERVVCDIFCRYAYREIRFPILENTALFKRSMGEVTDVVEKEMYSFEDLNGDSISLRPEGTAGCIRAVLEHALLYQEPQKLWYMGPMFRHEKPQKGRYRQFMQWGVEALGFEGTAPEIELLMLSWRLFCALGLSDFVRLELNTLGTLEERQSYQCSLKEYLKPLFDDLDRDSQRRLDKNPLRILDSKIQQTQNILKDAPKLWDYLGETSRNRFNLLCQSLDNFGIPYTLNPKLVRGLDYYEHTVFEWVSDHLGTQGTVLAGGRYDMLISTLGGEETPAVGFAIGAERLMMLVNRINRPIHSDTELLFYIISDSEIASIEALKVAEMLHQSNLNCRVLTHMTGGSFKSQFKKADKSGASFALIIGRDEYQEKSVSIKPLRTRGEQKKIPQVSLISYLNEILGETACQST